MRILNLDGHFFVKPFRKLGHEVLWLGASSQCDVQLDKTLPLSGLMNILDAKGFQPDLVVWADICKPPTVIGIESLPAVTIGFSIDQYCNPWHTSYGAAFDVMMLAQKDYLPGFEEASPGYALEWQPLFCDSYKDTDPGLERDIPVSFVGTVTGSINKSRKKFLDDFKRMQPLFVTQGFYVPIYNRSRIVVNQSAAGELNFRIFEAMGCGAAVLTEDTANGLHDLFTDGEDILLYPRGNPQVAAEVARKALEDPEKLAELAARGRRNVLKHHSSLIRAKHIIQRAEEVLASGPTWRKRNPKAARRLLANTYMMLAVDMESSLPQAQRDFYATLGRKIIAETK